MRLWIERSWELRLNCDTVQYVSACSDFRVLVWASVFSLRALMASRRSSAATAASIAAFSLAGWAEFRMVS